jgi:general stress protein 26
MEIEYNKLEIEVIDIISKQKAFILATSLNDIVTARTMCVVNIDLSIYFQTGSNSIKAKQIEKNAHVALSISNIQIEGLAECKGHPYLKENKRFLELYKDQHRIPYLLYSDLKDEIVFQVNPTLIKLWKYSPDGTKPLINILDITNKIAYMEITNMEKINHD